MDYLEILSFCAFDVDRADEMVSELVDKIQSKPDSE